MPERLPDLRGWVLRLYQIVWILAAVPALILLASSYRWEAQRQEQVITFFNAGLFPAGLANVVMPFSPEAKALFKGEHTLFGVSNVPTPDPASAQAQLKGPEGERRIVKLRDADGRVRHVSLTLSSRYLRDAYAGSGLTFGMRRWIAFGMGMLEQISFLAVATLLFLRRPRWCRSTTAFTIGRSIGFKSR